MYLSRGPKENRSRPSIDVLFRSAAYVHQQRVVGVLLSGMLDDGTSGLWAVKQAGGKAFVQHPEEALYPSMLLSAAQQVAVDAIVPARDLAARVQAVLSDPNFGQELPMSSKAVGLTTLNEHTQPHETSAERRLWDIEVSIAAESHELHNGLLNQGDFSAFTCPECHGVLIKIKEGQRIRFRCHTGHAYNSQSLLSEVQQSGEMSIWNAIRTLEEHAMLLEHLAKHAQEADQPQQADEYRQAALTTLK